MSYKKLEIKKLSRELSIKAREIRQIQDQESNIQDLIIRCENDKLKYIISKI